MSKLYIGNLPLDIEEKPLRQYLRENGLPCSTIPIKRGGYAFVDFINQGTADKAIDKLNGSNIFGTTIMVEPSVAETVRRRGLDQTTEKQTITTWQFITI